MKIGIFHDLVERFGLQDRDAQKQLRFVLRVYLARKLAYHRALLQHKHRYDLDGNPAGEISKDEKDHAHAQVKHIWEKRNKANRVLKLK